MGNLFGTDGIRGVAGETLDGQLAFRVGQAAALTLSRAEGHRARVLIGKDTRISSDMLEAALAAGVASVGADAILLGIIPSPAVAYLTVRDGADAGIVISASHNSFEHNGIKIFGREGFKLSDKLESDIEALIATPDTMSMPMPMPVPMPQAMFADVGRITTDDTSALRYVSFLAGTVDADLSHLRVAVDCANGAAARTAEALMQKIGIGHSLLFDRPDGCNINDRCGSTDMQALCGHVVEGGFDLGLAFDGDADRCLAVDHKGQIIDGDRILAICALVEKERGALSQDTVVATVMSNLGFHAFAKEHGFSVVTTAVGDRQVLEKMLACGYDLGGEQSGHLVFRRLTTTGDGQLTALRFLCAVAQSGRSAHELLSGFTQYPQVLVNVRVTGPHKRTISEHPEVCAAIAEAETALKGNGRILVRPSGTEPLVRVMVEGLVESQVRALADEVAAVISRVKAPA
ncbi:MAG: phosphoglucosamine mutase [Oscillospiraceae bacterium]|nr:phosphoglucosamine mutase [Oscillospiraceae bacterium]